MWAKDTLMHRKLPGSYPEQQRPYQQRHKRLQQGWKSLGSREQVLAIVATLAIVFALLWWVAISPALGILSTAGALQNSIDTQREQMKILQTEARLLQGQTKITGAAAVQALETSAKERFGASAQVASSGSQATLTLRGASGDALAQWLSQARLTARAVPVQAQLRRSGGDAGTWDGTLVLSLPAP